MPFGDLQLAAERALDQSLVLAWLPTSARRGTHALADAAGRLLEIGPAASGPRIEPAIRHEADSQSASVAPAIMEHRLVAPLVGVFLDEARKEGAGCIARLERGFGVAALQFLDERRQITASPALRRLTPAGIGGSLA